MQTFLPYPSFADTARVLDYRRLGKQRVEAKQIIMALEGQTKGWVNHPATKMWTGYEVALAAYGFIVCKEWTRRGYKDSLTPFFKSRISSSINTPHWLGNQDFHASHRSNLLRKDPVYYGQFGWQEDSTLPYIWP